ncbi:MAG: MFS transporter [Bacteroidales bacterium]|nr:MFS transporter [Bacteroidales bacterium]
MSRKSSIRKFQTSKVVSISFAHLIHDIYSSFLAPILPLLIEKLGLSYSLAGLLTIFQRIPSLLNPIIGLIADKAPIRYFIILTPAITAISMSLLGIAPNFIILGLLLFVMGLSAAFFHVPAPVLIKQLSGNRIGKGMSYYMLGGEIARTSGPLIILGAISIWGLEGTYKLIPFALLATIILYYKLKNIDIQRSNKKEREVFNVKSTLIKVLPIFSLLAGITFFRSAMKAALTTFLPTYLTLGQNESLWIGGISLAILELAGAAGTLVGGSISDKIGKKTTLIISATATPVLMFIFVYLSGFAMISLLILIGFFMFATSPVLLALVQEISAERPAFINGIYMTINFVIGALTVYFVGFLSDIYGLTLTYKISAIVALGSIPFVFMLPKKIFAK